MKMFLTIVIVNSCEFFGASYDLWKIIAIMVESKKKKNSKNLFIKTVYNS